MLTLYVDPPTLLYLNLLPDPMRAAPYTSVLECVRQTIRNNGVRGPFQVGTAAGCV